MLVFELARSKGAPVKYRQLTREQKYQIAAYLEMKMTQSEMARRIHVHRSTIGRELHRNKSGRWKYNASRAIRMTRERHERKRKHRIDEETWTRVEALLKRQWSPEQISKRLPLEGLPSASHETIYLYIYRDKQQGGELYLHLRRRHTYRKRIHKYCSRKGWETRRSIRERPSVVDTRSRLGDWEADTIVGRLQKTTVLSLVERRSRFCLLQKLANRSPDTLAEAVFKQLAPLADKVLTITSDNGLEFMRHERIANQLDADFFFADPYSSWQRGAIENTNGLVRQYFPKKTDFSLVAQSYFQQVCDRLNNRPRKSLGFRTPKEVFFNQPVALIT